MGEHGKHTIGESSYGRRNNGWDTTRADGLASLRITATLACTVATLLILNLVLTYEFQPNLESYRVLALSTFIPYTRVPAIPEPLEQLRFMVLAPAGCLLLALYGYLFWNVNVASIRSRRFAPWLVHAPAWIMGVPVLVAWWELSKAYQSIYLPWWMFVKEPKLFVGVILPSAFIAYRWARQRVFTVTVRMLCTLLVVIVFVVGVANALFTASAPPPPFHFNPMVYPIAMLRHGVAIGGKVLSVYGLYPAYVLPLVRLLGGDVTAVCIVFGLSIGVTYGALTLAVYWTIRNPVLKLCVVFTLPYMSYLSRVPIADPYYQYWPNRMLCPAMVLGALAWVVRASRYEKTALGSASALATTGLFWNVDSGMACVLALGMFVAVRLLYHWMTNAEHPRQRVRALLTQTMVPVLFGVSAATLGFYVVYALQARSLPNVLQSMRTTMLFAKVGYTFIPMADAWAYWHVWVLVLGVCAVCTVPLIRAQRHRLACYHAAVSAMGLGLLAYHFGRSDPGTLYGPLWIAPFVLGLLVERLDEQLRSAPLFAVGRIAQLVIFAHVISVPMDGYQGLKAQARAIRASLSGLTAARRQTSLFSDVVQFIHERVPRGRKIMVFFPDQDGIIYLMTRRKPALETSSSTDLLLRDEHARILDFLRANMDVPIFIPDSGAASRSPEIVNVLVSDYEIVASRPGVVQLRRKRGQ